MSDGPSGALTPRDFLYDQETESDLALFSAIGRIVVLWGQLEMHFSSAVMVLFHNFAESSAEDRPPGQIRRKLDFWRKSFRRIDVLSEHATHACSWADRMAVAANQRDMILHHNWANALHDGDLSAISGGGIRARVQGHELTSASMSLDELLNFAEEIELLNTRLLGFTFTIHKVQPHRG